MGVRDVTVLLSLESHTVPGEEHCSGLTRCNRETGGRSVERTVGGGLRRETLHSFSVN